MSRPVRAQAYRNQVYEELRVRHDSRRLFDDPEFAPNNGSLYYSKAPPRGICWRRPHQICAQPKFIVNGASRFDLDQGYVGNCWFIAAVSMITQRPMIFQYVVPSEQTFEAPYYNGLFRFRFWQFGQWYEVVVDDYLPVFADGRLVFCSNKTEPDEFWCSLLEKAYAKLSWSYEGLEAGQTTDGLIDMTGGIEETYELKDQDPFTFFNLIGNSLEHDAMMGCSINNDANSAEREAKLTNGLVKGHAFAITAVVTLNLKGRQVRLIRCRNPWGNEVEWNGAWSDKDPVWDQLPPLDRQRLGQYAKDDGEFWMSFEDWIVKFDQVQICNISPDTLKIATGAGSHAMMGEPPTAQWSCVQFDGEWVTGRSAGGSGQGSDRQKFWTNPQFRIRVDYSRADTHDSVLIVACMQKNTRQKRMKTNGVAAEEFIQVRIYRVHDEVVANSDAWTSGATIYPRDLERVATTGAYINKREVTLQCRVPVGCYVIIASTYEADREGQFLLRVFSEKRVESEMPKMPTPMSDEETRLAMLEFRDGKGDERQFGVKKWWEALPDEEQERYRDMLNMNVAVGCTAALCCCLEALVAMLNKGRNDRTSQDEKH